ncbi:MAG: hypothetical protein HYV41_05370 [Candidatus Magasanikbacteria bacterium]|nr:hypothetical protein [Candidatus Magasanikbacteria bacterium]
MDLGFIVINTSILSDFFSQTPGALIVQVFAIAGWIVFVWLLFFGGIMFYADYIQDKKTQSWKFVLLAIDIPQENVQTPMAVEQLFSHIAGAFDAPDLRGKFRDGYKQRWFSFEIISIEGYIQFLAWTEEAFRELLEGAIYAQYPEAEITEVEDYVVQVPEKYPHEEYDIWMADFALAEHEAYPLRSYREFEHNISKDTVLKDPMGTFLESFSRIGYGEQMWFQILVQPISNKWKEGAIAKIKELIGEKGPAKKGPLSFLTDNVVTKEFGLDWGEVSAQLLGGVRSEGADSKSVDTGDVNNLRAMTPGQVKLVEDMEKKISKIGLKTKMRAAYMARKEVFNPTRGVNALIGAINQFNIPTANSIIAKSTTGIRNKAKANLKKTEMVKAYRKRKLNYGANAFVLNIEELATIWHFPMSHVKTPMVQKATTKAAEPPIGLPVEYIDRTIPIAKSSADEKVKKHKVETMTDTGEVIEYDDFG